VLYYRELIINLERVIILAKDNLNRFNFVLPEPLATKIDEYRSDVGGLPPKAVAIRDLVQLGLETYWNNKRKDNRKE